MEKKIMKDIIDMDEKAYTSVVKMLDKQIKREKRKQLFRYGLLALMLYKEKIKRRFIK